MKLKFTNSFHKLPEKFYSKTEIEAFENPVLVHANTKLATQLGIDAGEKNFLDYFCGRKKILGSEVVSTVYSGHQFGSYVPQLGDGRAHLIGEIEAPNKEKFELQIKGSGKTPYSRFGDGKAVLRSSIREYLCSEAMHHLGVPTTRALCIIGSDEEVMREGPEKAAMVTRVAPSFIRFGHFEYFSHKGDYDGLKTLADFVIANYFPRTNTGTDKYQKFFYDVVSSTAKLIAKWQAFGFAHGVMNTDNMSILGLTIDYGPFGFMDEYQPGFICNCSDYSGRYSYESQPKIGLWNLYALAAALEPILPRANSQEVLDLYYPILVRDYSELMRKKLGLKERRDSDAFLIRDLMQLMADFAVDYTIFFRSLADFKVDEKNEYLYKFFKKPSDFEVWEEKYKKRIMQEEWYQINKSPEKSLADRRQRMNKINPKYILRNFMAEQAIRLATYANDFSEIDKLIKILEKPFDEQPEFEKDFFCTPPAWAGELSVSCSS
jgi:uncharacterized protein YdiU (UPF0061 family)